MKFFAVLLSVLVGLTTMAQSQEISWPQELTSENGGVVIIYQPQVEVFTGNNLEARAAVSVKSSQTGNTPVFGAVWIEAKLDTNRDTRTAVIRDIEVSDVRIADASNEQIDALANFIEGSLQGSSLEISVDQLLSDLDAADSNVGEADLKHTPPEIIVSIEPAMLVTIDGDPVLQEIEGSDYQRVVNSAFLIVNAGKTNYLYVGIKMPTTPRATIAPREGGASSSCAVPIVSFASDSLSASVSDSPSVSPEKRTTRRQIATISTRSRTPPTT